MVNRPENSIGWCSGKNEPLSDSAVLTPWMIRRNPQYKKHKTWDGDGVLVVNGNRCILHDTDGKPYVYYYYHPALIFG